MLNSEVVDKLKKIADRLKVKRNDPAAMQDFKALAITMSIDQLEELGETLRDMLTTK